MIGYGLVGSWLHLVAAGLEALALTTRGRDRDTRRFAMAHLQSLRSALGVVAPTTSPGWLADETLGFIVGHVQAAFEQAGIEDFRPKFIQPQRRQDAVRAFVEKVAPEVLGLQPLSFARAFADCWRRWPTDPAGGAHPIIRGALNGAAIIREIHGPSALRVPDEATKQVEAIATEYGRLPGRNPVWGRVFRSPARAYRYLVLRTLGASVFGVTTEAAAGLAARR